MPHTDADRSLRVQLATALRERDTQKARAEKAEAEHRKTTLFYNCGAEPPCERCITCQWDDAREALAAARRDLSEMDTLFLGTLAGIVTAIPGDAERIDDWLRTRIGQARDQFDRLRKGRASLAAPAAGRDPAIEDADAAWRDGEAHGRDE